MSIDEQVFSDSQLVTDGGELWADTERETCVAGGVDDRDTLDLDIAGIGDDITAFGFRGLKRDVRTQTKDSRC